jgi:NAD(P)H-quinone oxidoreductase subunit M
MSSTLLKSTTRHIRIFSGAIENDELVPNETQLTLDVDPDNELLWNDEALQQVYRKFDELVTAYDGAELTDYNLRRIGSDLELFVRSLLQIGQVSYNLNSRVRNYSLGLPRLGDDGSSSNHLAIENSPATPPIA